jgi:hypothetical protein
MPVTEARLPLQPPPRDDQGIVVPHDHDGIAVADGVLRRISDQQLVDDPKSGGRRISSMAFKASTGLNGGMSVDLQQSIEAAGLNARDYVTTPKWMGSLRFEAGCLRAEGFMVGFEPLPDNLHHGEVWGKFSKPQQRRIIAMAVWFVAISGVAIS